MKELTIDAVEGNLNTVLDFIDGELEKDGCSENVRTNTAIAVEEIFVNIAHYAYNPTVGNVVMRITVDKEVTIEFEDAGTPYNPLEKENPDFTTSALDREIGGLGIFMVKQLMDSVEYRHKDGKNILKIRKELG